MVHLAGPDWTASASGISMHYASKYIYTHNIMYAGFYLYLSTCVG